MSKCKCFGEHGGKNHTGKGQLSLSLSTRGWGRERGVTTSSLFGVGPSISRSASVFLNNLDHNHDTITIDITITYLCLLLLPTPSCGSPLFKPAKRTQALHTWDLDSLKNINV